MEKVIKIKDALTFLKKSKIKAGEGLDNGEYPFYTSSSIQNRYLNSYEVEGESLIFGTGGNASVHHSQGKFTTSTDCFVVQSNNKFKIDLKYIYLYLSGNIRILENGFKGAGLKHISKKYIEDIEIPLPSLETQKKIVEDLDKSQELIDARKEQIKMMDKLIQSVFFDMFGNPLTNPNGFERLSVRDCIKIIGGCAFESKKFVDQGIPIIKIGTANKGYFDTLSFSFWEENYSEKFKKYEVYPGDLLITLTGTVGKDDYGNICEADDTFNKYLLNQRVAKLEINSNVNKAFLKYYFMQREVKGALIKLSRGVRQANISNEDIYGMSIYIPPIELQKKFSKVVLSVETQKKLLSKTLLEMEQYFYSIMKNSFNA